MKPGICKHHPSDAPHHQPRAGQQHEREREIADDQEMARATRAAAGSSARVGRERLTQPERRAAERRNKAEAETRERGDDEREREHPSVETHLIEARDRDRGDRRHALKTNSRDRQTERAAGEAEDRALGQQLPDQAPAAGAKRRADRDLARPVHRPREEQVGDVRAGNQHHEPDRAQQHEQGRAHRTGDRYLERHDGHLARRVVGRVIAAEL